MALSMLKFIGAGDVGMEGRGSLFAKRVGRRRFVGLQSLSCSESTVIFSSIISGAVSEVLREIFIFPE